MMRALWAMALSLALLPATSGAVRLTRDASGALTLP